MTHPTILSRAETGRFVTTEDLAQRTRNPRAREREYPGSDRTSRELTAMTEDGGDIP